MSLERGSDVSLRSMKPSFVEIQDSLVTVSSRSLPSTPTGIVLVLFVPVARTPSICREPRSSTTNFSRGSVAVEETTASFVEKRRGRSSTVGAGTFNLVRQAALRKGRMKYENPAIGSYISIKV